MEKIDRLGWTAGISFETYGLRMGIRVNDPAVLPRVREQLPPGWRPSSADDVELLYSLRVAPPSPHRGRRGFNLLYAGSTRVARTLDRETVLRSLENDVTQSVGNWSRGFVFVHAGVVAWRGRALILPGSSFTGKSTLTAALVEAGCTYYSDEYAVLDADGMVHPYARPLSLRAGDAPSRRHLKAEDLGGRAGTGPVAAGWVVATRYEEGAVWDPQPLTAGRLMLALTDHAVPARIRPAEVMESISRVADQAVGLRGVRGQADAVARTLLDLMDSAQPGCAEGNQSARTCRAPLAHS